MYAWFTFSHWLIYANSAANPIIYNFLSGELVISYFFFLETLRINPKPLLFFSISSFLSTSRKIPRGVQSSLLLFSTQRTKSDGEDEDEHRQSKVHVHPSHQHGQCVAHLRSLGIVFVDTVSNCSCTDLAHVSMCYCVWWLAVCYHHTDTLFSEALEIIPLKTLFAGLSQLC